MIEGLPDAWIAALTRPSVQTFDALKASASRERTLAGVAIAAVVSAIVSAILTLVAASFLMTIGFGGLPYPVAIGAAAVPAAFVRSLVQTFIGFYLFAYVLQFVATQLRGRGNFEVQAYLLSTYYVPISILGAILVFVPCIGPLVALVLGIYGLVLTTFAVQSEQGFETGKAIVTWIIAAIATGIVLGILGIISGGWL